MIRYLLSPAAQQDLEEIWDYNCGRWDTGQAEEYLRELQRAIERVAANPRIGRACDEIRPGYFKLAAGSHTLFYRVIAAEVIADEVIADEATEDEATEDEVIDVVRILHQRMDVHRHL